MHNNETGINEVCNNCKHFAPDDLDQNIGQCKRHDAYKKLDTFTRADLWCQHWELIDMAKTASKAPAVQTDVEGEHGSTYEQATRESVPTMDSVRGGISELTACYQGLDTLMATEREKLVEYGLGTDNRRLDEQRGALRTLRIIMDGIVERLDALHKYVTSNDQ